MVLFRGSWVEKEDVDERVKCGNFIKGFWARKFLDSVPNQYRNYSPYKDSKHIDFFFFWLKTLTELWLTLRARLECTKKVDRRVYIFWRVCIFCVGHEHYSRDPQRLQTHQLFFFFLAENFNWALAKHCVHIWIALKR